RRTGELTTGTSPAAGRGGAASASARRVIPFLLPASHECRAVLGKNPVLLNEIIERPGETVEIVRPAGVALIERLARIAGLATLARRFGERDVRTFEGHALLRSSDRGIAKIPTGIGPQRYYDLRKADPIALIAIIVDLRNQCRKGLPYLRRLHAENTLTPLWPEIQAIRITHLHWRVDTGNWRKRVIAQRDECPVIEAWIAAAWRRGAAAHPRVHVGNHRSPEKLDGQRRFRLLPEQITVSFAGRERTGEMLQPGEMVDPDIVRDRHVLAAFRVHMNERCDAPPVLVRGVGKEDFRHDLVCRRVIENAGALAGYRIRLGQVSERKEVGWKKHR